MRKPSALISDAALPHRGACTVIIVNYHSQEPLQRALESLARMTTTIPFGVIVVNNSKEENLRELPNVFPFIQRLMAPEINIGFARAVNLAASAVTTEYMLLLNPDTLIEGRALDELVAVMARHHDAGSVGPMIVYPDGRLQPTRGAFPTLLTTAAYLFAMKRLMPRDEVVIGRLGSILGRWFGQYRPLEGLQQVDYTVGSCVLLRTSAFKAIGGMDGRFFLFYDEIDFSKRLAAHGWKRLYWPSARVIHHVGQSYSERSIDATREKFLSLSIYFQKHHGTLVNAAVRLLQIASLVCRWLKLRLESLWTIKTQAELRENLAWHADMLHLFSSHPLRTIARSGYRPLVSACLIGVACTFTGEHHQLDPLRRLHERRRCIPFCPEHAGGLPTPRSSASICGNSGEEVLDGSAQVITEHDADVTSAFQRGARRALLTARLYGAKLAIMKARSPSCGTRKDLHSSHGNGVAAALLQRWGIAVVSEETLGFQLDSVTPDKE